jgi:hypothetical protein
MSMFCQNLRAENNNLITEKRVKACESVIKSCDEALKAQRNLNLKIENQLEHELKLGSERDKKIKELEESNNSWYKNPFLLIGIGLVGGVVLAK